MSRVPIPPEVIRGLRDAAPVLLGVAPFGLVAGAAAVDAGLTPAQAIGLSVVVFAGASQLAAIDLFGSNAELLVIVLTGVVINLRMLMYSASIAPRFRALRSWWKSLCAYVLTDQAYALSIARYADEELNPAERRNYYLAVGVSLWVVWQSCTILGIVAGARIPDAWGLEFAVPLVFLSLLVPAVSSLPTFVAAVVGGTVAVAGTVVSVPFDLGIIAGGVVGVAAGVATDAALGGTRSTPEPGGEH
ncbi:MAG: AzlC family ABC transporter permease [Halobellus sp.]|uniref:AzlC family ABC transporter permease n=1 Tax=Halobellus sp. TaxID=1979212 RepID=UPI0035D3EF83